MEFTNIASAFKARTDSPGNIIFMDQKGRYTTYSYEELWEKSLMYVSYLKKQGINKGDTLSLILPTCPEFIMIFMAAQIIGAIPVSLYPMMSIGDIDAWKKRTIKMINEVESQHFFGTNVLKEMIFSDLKRNKINAHTIENINLENETSNISECNFPKADDLCFLQFSSGTTSDPKPVMITQKNALLNATLIANKIGIQKELINTVSWLPLYHDMGLVGTFIASIIGGRNLILIKPNDFIKRPFLWLKAISDYKAQVTTAPNFAYGLAVKRVTQKQKEKLDLTSLHLAGCGGEAVYKETIDKFIDTFGPYGLNPSCLTPMYGMAEATVAVSFSSHLKPITWKKFDEEQLSLGHAKETPNGKYLCSLGTPLSTFSVEIRNTEDLPLKENQVGRIYLEGPSVFKGYFNNSKKTDESFSNNMLDTGDLGFLNNGEIYITGRAKDTMIIRGRNYYPTIFEESLTKIKSLREGRVVVSSTWFPDSDSEEMIVLAEVTEEKFLKNREELEQQIISLLSKTGEITPKVIEFYLPGTLPKTSSGKLRRAFAVELWKRHCLGIKKELHLKNRTQLFQVTIKDTIDNTMKQLASINQLF